MITQTSLNNELAMNDPGLNNLPNIRWHSDGQLRVSINGGQTEVRVYQCFPWSDPASYISLRDFDENEVTLIERISDLDPVSRYAVGKALAAAGFVLEITALISVEEDFEIRNWHVITSQGSRKFQTRLDDQLRPIPGNGPETGYGPGAGFGLLIEDVAGDLFHIENPEKLDKKSQKLLWAFID